MTMRALITGCNGLIGTAITQRLNTLGYFTVGVTKDKERPSFCNETHFGSATDKQLIIEVMRNIDVVIHLAAIRTPRFDPPDVIFKQNSLSTFNVITHAAEVGVHLIIHASSISTLGFSFSQEPLLPQYLPIDESHPCRVSDAYGLSKLIDEQTVRYVRNRYKSHIYAIRFPYVGDAEVLLHQRAAHIEADSGFAKNDFWSYLDIEDAISAIEILISERPLLDDPIFTLVAPNTLSKTPTELLLKKHFPELQKSSKFPAFSSVFVPSILLEKSSFQFTKLFKNE